MIALLVVLGVYLLGCATPFLLSLALERAVWTVAEGEE
jgi:hypothetical protein